MEAAEHFMKLALDEARRGLGRTSPNPAVGAVLVKAGRIISRGFHKKAGAPHAEVVAIHAAGARARGADLYTTLEPCNHFGRTPPCSEAILAAGIRRVFCGSRDPNPLVNGRGVARLRRAGVRVVTGVLEQQTDAVNRPFFKVVTTRLPYVTLKAAITLDGKLATGSGDSRWVSGEISRAKVHSLRDQVDAILVGAETVRRDNPRLTTRIARGGRDAVRVVLDSKLRLSSRHRIFRPESGARTIVATTVKPTARSPLAKAGEVWSLPAKRGGVDLRALLRRLAAAGLNHVLVEGGARVFESFLVDNLADEVWLFVAPKLVGDPGITWSGKLKIGRMSRARRLEVLAVERSGDDVLIQARCGKP